MRGGCVRAIHFLNLNLSLSLSSTILLRRLRGERPHRQHAPASIRRNTTPDPDLERADAELQHLGCVTAVRCRDLKVDDGAGAEQQGFADAQLDDLVEDCGGGGNPRCVAVVGGLAEGGEVLLQALQPVGRGEAVGDCDGAQVEELGGDGRFLRGDEDARAEVALETDGGEERVGQGVGFGCVVHVLDAVRE